jgi:glutathione S-transferase
MTEFTVHSIPGSPYGRAVLATLEEKDADYRLAPLTSGALRVEPHLSRHPFGRIPALEHDGFMLYETQAILRYLDRVLTEPALTPADAKAAARMDQAMNVNDWYLYQGVGNVIVFHRVVAPRLMGSAPDEAAVAAAMPKARVTFRELSRLLGTQSYFAGDAMSLADLMIAPQLDLFARAPEWAALTADAPNLVEWLERVTLRPIFEATTWERLVAIAEAA